MWLKPYPMSFATSVPSLEGPGDFVDQTMQWMKWRKVIPLGKLVLQEGKLANQGMQGILGSLGPKIQLLNNRQKNSLGKQRQIEYNVK